jgi:hypothetical protein
VIKPFAAAMLVVLALSSAPTARADPYYPICTSTDMRTFYDCVMPGCGPTPDFSCNYQKVYPYPLPNTPIPGPCKWSPGPNCFAYDPNRTTPRNLG